MACPIWHDRVQVELAPIFAGALKDARKLTGFREVRLEADTYCAYLNTCRKSRLKVDGGALVARVAGTSATLSIPEPALCPARYRHGL